MANQGSSSILESPAPSPRQRSELGRILWMSIPVVVTNSSRALMDVVDFTLVKYLNDPEAMAAILPAQMLVWTFIVIGFGLVAAVNTFASQAVGRGEPREASAFAWQSVYLAALFGLIALALVPFLPAIVEFIGLEPGVQERQLAYARVCFYGVAPTILFNALGWFFIGIHRPWTTMWASLEANVVNAIVAYMLMFGSFGICEPMGIAGAAWGTFVAVTYRSIRLVITMMSQPIAGQFGCRATWRPSWSRLVRLCRVGAPMSFSFLCDVAVWAIFVNVLIGRNFGTVDLIATNAAWQYMRIAFFPIIGLGQAATALVGKSIGSGELNRAEREVRLTVIITLAYIGALSVLYGGFGERMIGWFYHDAEVMRVGGRVLLCVAVFQLFDALGIVYTAALRGAGDTFWPSVFFSAANWLFIVGGGWVMVTYFRAWGSAAPWIAATALFIVGSAYLWWRWRRGGWRSIDLFGGTPRAAAIGDVRAEALGGPESI